MIKDWNAYRDVLLGNMRDFASHTPDTVRGLKALEKASVKTGHLDPKIHELIALAVAVTTRCDGCISVHTKKAVEHGATVEEITEALGVAITLNAGAAMTYSAHVMDAYAQITNK